MRKPIPKTPDYLAAFSRAQHVDPDIGTCGVIAMSIVTGLPYDECRKLLIDQGMDLVEGVFQWQLWRALRAGGFSHRRLDQRDIIAGYPPAKQQGRTRATTRQIARFPDAWKSLPPCLVFTKGHVAGLRDGVLHDWSASNSFRIIDIHAIERIPS